MRTRVLLSIGCQLSTARARGNEIVVISPMIYYVQIRWPTRARAILDIA